MARNRVLPGLVAIAALGTTPAAQACSVIATHEPSPREKQLQARKVMAMASAIIDGEVVRPYDRKIDTPALVRAHHILKGPQHPYFEVGGDDNSCDIALERKGERMRMVLAGAPGTYHLPADWVDPAYIDRELKSDRRKTWPWVRGGVD